MADFRKVQAANESDTEYQRNGQEIEDQSPAETARLLRQNQAAQQAQENESPAETARLLRQNQAALEQQYPDTEFGDLEGAMARVAQADAGDASRVIITDKKIKGRPNPLDDYANYTYGLSLHIIPIETYNALAQGGTYNPNGNVLIASAGRHGEPNFVRRANFQEDFYFENLKFTTVIGYNSRNRGSNVIDVSFTILEPYGITLLDRLLQVATDIGAENWGQMPFMLQIDFYGNTDGGQSVAISEHTKYIPIKMIACNVKASTRGSEYRINAVPYNHQAFHETVGVSPAFLEVIAGKVGEFFQSGDDAAGEAGSIISEKEKFKQEKERIRNEGFENASNEIRDVEKQESAAKSTAFRVGSYAAALNSYQDQLKKFEYQDEADRYEFIIDDEIAKSELVSPKFNNVKSTPMATKNNELAKMIQGLRARETGGSVPVTVNKQVIPINAGTTIIDVINLALRNSKYISDQVDPKKGETVGSDPINFYKIVPEIILGNFDNKRKVYQKTFRYHIKKFSYYNTRYPGAKLGVPQSWEKTYDYMYTGKNQSILDFNIEFDTMFYTAMTANAAKFKEGEIDAAKKEKDQGTQSVARANKRLAMNQIKFVPNQTWSGTDTVGNNDIKNIGANDLYQSIMTNSRGDMIVVKLKISGDPELIKQDDYYSNLGTSLSMDAGEIFAYLSFRSPSDIDQNTGLYDFTSYPQSVFSGLYKIITVENSFERGQFTQSLDLIRLMEQAADQTKSSSAKSLDELRPANEKTDSRSVAENDAVDELMRRMDAGKIIPGESSTALYAEDKTLSRSRINTETGEAYNPVIDSVDGQDYFDQLKQLKNKVSSAPETAVTDETLWTNVFGPSGA